MVGGVVIKKGRKMKNIGRVCQWVDAAASTVVKKLFLWLSLLISVRYLMLFTGAAQLLSTTIPAYAAVPSFLHRLLLFLLLSLPHQLLSLLFLPLAPVTIGSSLNNLLISNSSSANEQKGRGLEDEFMAATDDLCIRGLSYGAVILHAKIR